MAGIVVLSNVLVQFLLGNWLTFAAFTYPFAFLVTDIANRLLGAQSARRVATFGFTVGVVCSFIGTQIMNGNGEAYVTVQMAVASGAAFLLAQLLDVYIFQKVQTTTWYAAPLVSSVAGGMLDTLLFFTLAFSPLLLFLNPTTDAVWARELIPFLGIGPAVPLWISLAAADFAVKLCILVISLVPFRFFTKMQ